LFKSAEKNSNTLALFDFDGTLTDRDNLPDFIVHAVGWIRYMFVLFVLSPILALYLFKLIRNYVAKEKMLRFFFSGWRLIAANCYGQEKVTRICAELDLSEYNSIYAYGDSSGDKPMLALADKAFYKPFRI
jgi:hypothetical protein